VQFQEEIMKRRLIALSLILGFLAGLVSSGQAEAMRGVPADPGRGQARSGKTALPGIDIDVTYISREPRYQWNAAKQWPADGETVIFTAHVMNKGTVTSGAFSYQWLLDGRVVSTAGSSAIPPQAERTFAWTWHWQTGHHAVEFRADTQNQVSETAETNNRVFDYTDALTVAFWVEQSVYNLFNTTENGSGTYSWEDWAQRQIMIYNDLLARSKWPQAPEGVLTRLRLDKITIVPDGTLYDLNPQHAPLETETDFQWGISVEEFLNCPWPECYDVSWGLLHELGHYLFGRADLYGLDVQGGDVDVRDQNGNPIAGTPLLPFIAWDVVHYNSRGYDLMASFGYPDPVFLSDHTVYSLNRDWPRGQRTHAGGSYIYEIPAESRLRVLDSNDRPLPNLQVSIYQAVAGNGDSGAYSQFFDNTPDITGTTDAQGILSLGARPFGSMQNYWALTAGDILVKLYNPASGETRYVWVEVVDFNLAYWRGETVSYTHTIYFPKGTRRLRLSQNQLAFLAPQGSSPAPQKIDVAILGEDADKRWIVLEPTVPWLRTNPYSAHSGVGFQPGALAFVIESANLSPGTYTATVAITDAAVIASPQTVKVTLDVKMPSSFSDVPFDHWAMDWIERLYAAGITGGCAVDPLRYCPEASVSRDQMAVFLERGMHGSSYSPPAASGHVFGDVPASYWAAAWIEKLAADRITAGCGEGNYCPAYPVTRAQMAIFLLKAKHGSAYTPPAAGPDTGFNDVPSNYWAAGWIKQLAVEGITGGCAADRYCPENPVTRAQMAVFLVKTFGLP